MSTTHEQLLGSTIQQLSQPLMSNYWVVPAAVSTTHEQLLGSGSTTSCLPLMSNYWVVPPAVYHL